MSMPGLRLPATTSIMKYLRAKDVESTSDTIHLDLGPRTCVRVITKPVSFEILALFGAQPALAKKEMRFINASATV